MKTRNLTEQSLYSDWVFVFALNGITAWDPDLDEVVLGISPDSITWDDYGLQSYTFGMVNPRPFMQFTSTSGDGVITLTDPNTIYIQVPGTQLSRCGPGTVNVGLSHRRLDTGSRQTILHGRLPLLNTGV